MRSTCDYAGLVRDFLLLVRAYGLFHNIPPPFPPGHKNPGFSPGKSIYICHFQGQVTGSNDNQSIQGAIGEKNAGFFCYVAVQSYTLYLYSMH